MSCNLIENINILGKCNFPQLYFLDLSSNIINDFSVEPIPPIFTPESINTKYCEKYGIITIKGKFNDNIEGVDFNIVSDYGVFQCFFDGAEKDQEVNLECYLTEIMNNSPKIFFPLSDILVQNRDQAGNYEQIIDYFIFKPISMEGSDVICTIMDPSNPLPPPSVMDSDIQTNNNIDSINISFRQICRFETRIEIKIIVFYFIGMSSTSLNKGESMSMKVKLNKGGELVDGEAKCTANEGVEPKDGEQAQVDFECHVENVEEASEYKSLEFVESGNITGVPSNPDLLNPVKVDHLIEDGKVKNYTSEESKNEEIPVFNPTSIDTTDSDKTGIFVINGDFLSEYTSQVSFSFEITLVTGQKAICTIPKVNNARSAKIECVLQQELTDSKIIIQDCAALDGYNEKIRINQASSEENVNVANGKEVEIQKTFDVSLSFGQLSRFKAEQNYIIFIFVGYITKRISKGETITMKVNLIKEGELVEEEAKCTVIEDINPNDGEQTNDGTN